MTAVPVINRMVDLYDVDATGLADGRAPVRQGTAFVLVDVATQAELDAETSARVAADAAAQTTAIGAAAGLALVLGG